MPTYCYLCSKCNKLVDIFHGINDELPRECKKCKSKMKKIPCTGYGFILKGEGFYRTEKKKRELCQPMTKKEIKRSKNK